MKSSKGGSIRRHSRGGIAVFGPGAAVETFTLTRDIRLAAGISVRADADDILVFFKHLHCDPAAVRAELDSIALKSRYRFDDSPGRSMDTPRFKMFVISFVDPEDPFTALRHLVKLPNMGATLAYSVTFTMPEEVEYVLHSRVAAINEQHARPGHSWWNYGTSNETERIVRISGTDQEDVLQVKIIMEGILFGDVPLNQTDGTTNGELWHDFFATKLGHSWLHNFVQEEKVVVISDSEEHRLHLYHQETAGFSPGMQLVMNKLRQKVEELGGPSVRFSQKTKAVSLTHLLGRLRIKSASSKSRDLRLCSICGVDPPDVTFPCSHGCCKDCFNSQLKAARTSRSPGLFPIRCYEVHKDKICSKPIPLEELCRHTTRDIFDSLLDASLNNYILSHGHEYRNCRRPDCDFVYGRSRVPEIFTCPGCIWQTCRSCDQKPHVGYTCAENSERLVRESTDKSLLESYKTSSGTKDCPKCGTLIVKVGGCNHIKCVGCHIHICWLCMTSFLYIMDYMVHMGIAHEESDVDWVD